MTRPFLYIYDRLSGHRRLTGCVLLLLFAVFAVVALQVHYEEDIAKFLPHDAHHERCQQVYQQIAMQDRIAVIFTSADTTRRVSSDRMTDAMEAWGGYMGEHAPDVPVQVSIDDERVLDMMRFVSANIPYFLNTADYERIDSLLAQPGRVRQQLEDDKAMLLLPAAGTLSQAMPYDPLQLFGPVLGRMRGLQMSNQFDTADGYLFSADGRMAMATMNSPYGSSETQRNALLAAAIDSAIMQTQADYPDIRVSAIGAPLVAVTNASQIKSDSLKALSVAAVLILFILWYHYRRWRDILWVGVSIVFGWLFALTGMALLKESVSIIVLGIGSVIIGIAVNYPLHFIDHTREVQQRREALKEMVPPLLIGNITTVAAFLCLVWLDAQAMRDLGLFGALMLVGTILFVLVALPVMKASPSTPQEKMGVDSPEIKGKENSDEVQGKRGNLQISSLKPQSSTLRGVLFLAVTLFLGYFSLKTSFDSDLMHINYMTAQQKEDMRVLTAMTQEAPLYAVAEGGTLDEALQANDSLMATVRTQTDSIAQAKKLSADSLDIKGVGMFVPSVAAQQRAIDQWTEFWSNGKGERLMAETRSAAQALGFKAEVFQPFYDLISTAPGVQTADYFRPLTDPLTGMYILEGHDKCQIVNYIYGPTAREMSIDGKHAFTFTRNDISNQLVNVLNDSFNYVGWVCGIVVFFFLWLSFGKIELAMLSFLPLAVGWIWILGLMQLFGVQFNIVNIILASFIFGQGDDYTIFITEGLMYEYTTGRKRLASYKRSIAVSALLMFAGIGCLILAKHPALRSLAIVTIIGMATVVVMAWYLPPLVFRWLTTKHGERRAVPITLKRVAYSLYSITFFLAIMYLFMKPFTWFYFHIGKTTEKKRLRFHTMIQKMSAYIIRHVPGVKFSYDNLSGETFERPAVIVCNHQSHLDLMCLLMLTPKMVFLTNDWVWRNPFYGSVIRRAEFYPVSDGIENNLPRLRDLYERGYSICVFPEGTRSPDCNILRFHKGAFYLARMLGADILPVFLHGAGHVLPKEDFMLREGAIHVEVNSRIGAEEHPDDELADRTMTKRMHRYYLTHYQELCDRIETEDYWRPYEKYKRYYEE